MAKPRIVKIEFEPLFLFANSKKPKTFPPKTSAHFREFCGLKKRKSKKEKKK